MTRLMTLLLNKKKTIIIELVDDVINKTNPFQNVSIEDTWIRRRHI